MIRRWQGWVDYWREEEAPDTLALGRIVWGLGVLAYLVHMLIWPGIPELFYRPMDGGVFPRSVHAWSLFAWFTPTPTVIWAVVVVNLAATVSFTVGLGTRAAAVVMWVCNVSLMRQLSLYGFGADSLVSVFSFLMVLAPLGASWSVDAAQGRGRASVPCWPRRLVIAQITLMYVKTGIVKAGSTWSFSGGHSALYYVLNDPGFARVPGRWAAWLYPLTQLGTFVARWWETLFFVVPWNMHLRSHPPVGGGAARGRVGRWMSAVDLRPAMLGTGVALHVALATFLELGMFSWVTLSLYPFFLKPTEARAVLERLSAWVPAWVPWSRGSTTGEAP